MDRCVESRFNTQGVGVMTHMDTHGRTYVCVHLHLSKEVDTVRMYHEYVGGRGNGYQPLCRNTV